MAVEPILGPASNLEASAYASTLYERHARSIYAHCLSRLGNRADAEDALQATYLNALRSFRRGVMPELELAWLFAIANRVVSNRRRADARRRRVETPHDLQELHDVLAAPATGEVDLVRLRESLAAMPEQQRRAFLLREWQGLSCAEIALELGVSNGAVEQLLFRARRTLQHELTKPQRRLRRLRGLGLGSLLLRLKTLLGAVKVAAVATTAVVATVGVVEHSHPLRVTVRAAAEPRPSPIAFLAPNPLPAVHHRPAVTHDAAPSARVSVRPTGTAVAARPRVDVPAPANAASPPAPPAPDAPPETPSVAGSDEDAVPVPAPDDTTAPAEDDTAVLHTTQTADLPDDPGPPAELPVQAQLAIVTHAAGTPAAASHDAPSPPPATPQVPVALPAPAVAALESTPPAPEATARAVVPAAAPALPVEAAAAPAAPDPPTPSAPPAAALPADPAPAPAPPPPPADPPPAVPATPAAAHVVPSPPADPAPVVTTDLPQPAAPAPPPAAPTDPAPAAAGAAAAAAAPDVAPTPDPPPAAPAAKPAGKSKSH